MKGSHLLGKDDHVTYRHHRNALQFLFFSVEHWALVDSPAAAYPAFSSKLQLISRVRTMSAVTTKSRTFRWHGKVVHQFQHEVFEDHTQAARSNLALKCQLRNGFQRIVREAQSYIFEFEQPLILLQQGVLSARSEF